MENPAIAEKIQFLELSIIAWFYCTMVASCRAWRPEVGSEVLRGALIFGL